MEDVPLLEEWVGEGLEWVGEGLEWVASLDTTLDN